LHPYRTTGKIIVLYIVIYDFRQQMRRQKFQDWMVASITRIQSPTLQAVEIQFIRSVIGITRRDKIRKDDIRYNLHVEYVTILTNGKVTGKPTYNAWPKIEFEDKLWTVNSRE
jgi:hypothetical protein